MLEKTKASFTDIVVVCIILIFTGFMFIRNQSSVNMNINTIQSPEEVNSILIKQIYNTPLDKSFVINSISRRIKNSYFKMINHLSEKKVFSDIIHFFNKYQGIVEDCSSCLTVSSCGESSQPSINYPIGLTLEALHTKISQYPHLMIIDVRNTNTYLSSHIPSSVSMPLLVLVNQMFTVDRWTEIVIVGDSYFQTKLAGESLLRLNFHRLHRLIVSVNSWDKGFESFK